MFTDTCTAKSHKGVMVFAEQHSNKTAAVALELLGVGRRLADSLGTTLSAALMTDSSQGEAEKLIHYGADIVYLVEHPSLTGFKDDVFSNVLTQLISAFNPEIVLIGATAFGRSIAPRTASSLNTGLTADCTGLEIDPSTGLLLQTRPAFGGNLMATITCRNHRPQMATVRPGVMKAAVPEKHRKGRIIKPGITIPGSDKIQIMGTILEENRPHNLADAEIIVAAGRGLEKAENLRLVEELAAVLGGAVGVTRAVVDAGWIGSRYQIGQTGLTVNPKIYFACGISGAIQHIAGIASSDIFVAINKNPEAPIFKSATYGLVGNVLDILPALIDEFRKKKEGCTITSSPRPPST